MRDGRAVCGSFCPQTEAADADSGELTSVRYFTREASPLCRALTRHGSKTQRPIPYEEKRWYFKGVECFDVEKRGRTERGGMEGKACERGKRTARQAQTARPPAPPSKLFPANPIAPAYKISAFLKSTSYMLANVC